jgi:hypothetical protein
MPSQQTIQQRAVLILMMLAGAECYRLDMNVETINGLRETLTTLDTVKEEANNVMEEAAAGGGNKVCRNPEMRNARTMEDRWKAKADKMRALASVIKAKKGASLWNIMELRKRLKMWDSCLAIHKDLNSGKTSGNSNVPLEHLFGADATDKYSLTNVMNDVTATLASIRVSNSSLEGCGLDTANINIADAVKQADETVEKALPAGMATDNFQVINAQAAQAYDIVMKQIYGGECKHSQKQQYQESLGDKFKADLWQLDRKIKKAIKEFKSSDPLKDNGDVIKRTIQDIDNIDGGSDSQVSDDSLENDVITEEETRALNGEDLEGDGSLLEVGDFGATIGVLFLIVIICLILFYLICYFNGFSLDIGRNSWSASGYSKNRCK